MKKTNHDVQDWDGGNIESDAPKLTFLEGIMVTGMIIIAFIALIPFMIYDTISLFVMDWRKYNERQ